MRFTVFSLFPNEFQQFLVKGLIKKAHDKHLFSLDVRDIRTYATDKHRHVDDYPYAHQKGMLLKADVLYNALSSVPDIESATVLYPCPKGDVFHHKKVEELVTHSDHIVIVCGYYEGVDERIFELFPIQRVSFGDFILTSGEIPALGILDAVIRRIPGVLGNADCLDNESIISHVLEAPQYTKPAEFLGKTVPKVLLSGDHGAVKKWERTESLKLTLFKKPHLLSEKVLSDEDRAIIVGLLKNQAGETG